MTTEAIKKIELAAPMRVHEAVELAIAELRERAAETDTASPEGWRVRTAIETLEALLAQQGCEHLDPGGDGLLTTLCDVVIFG